MTNSEGGKSQTNRKLCLAFFLVTFLHKKTSCCTGTLGEQKYYALTKAISPSPFPKKRYGSTSAHIARECPESFHVALGLVRRSPYKAAFDRQIRRLSEGGFVIKWTRDHMERAGRLTKE